MILKIPETMKCNILGAVKDYGDENEFVFYFLKMLEFPFIIGILDGIGLPKTKRLPLLPRKGDAQNPKYAEFCHR